MGVKIKPCPFCGESGTLTDSDRWPRRGKYEGQMIRGFTVLCLKMTCPIYHADNKYWMSGKAAINAWNRRAKHD